ncbi:hypothetical protein L6232_19940, partial [Shewanella sp. C31]|nr:hypothetical protein [Shewanella electrica]
MRFLDEAWPKAVDFFLPPFGQEDLVRRVFQAVEVRVVQALSASALTLPLGSLEEGEKRLVYTLRRTPTTAEEVANLLLDPS